MFHCSLIIPFFYWSVFHPRHYHFISRSLPFILFISSMILWSHSFFPSPSWTCVLAHALSLTALVYEQRHLGPGWVHFSSLCIVCSCLSACLRIFNLWILQHRVLVLLQSSKMVYLSCGRHLSLNISVFLRVAFRLYQEGPRAFPPRQCGPGTEQHIWVRQEALPLWLRKQDPPDPVLNRLLCLPACAGWAFQAPALPHTCADLAHKVGLWTCSWQLCPHCAPTSCHLVSRDSQLILISSGES